MAAATEDSNPGVFWFRNDGVTQPTPLFGKEIHRFMAFGLDANENDALAGEKGMGRVAE